MLSQAPMRLRCSETAVGEPRLYTLPAELQDPDGPHATPRMDIKQIIIPFDPRDNTTFASDSPTNHLKSRLSQIIKRNLICQPCMRTKAKGEQSGDMIPITPELPGLRSLEPGRSQLPPPGYPLLQLGPVPFPCRCFLFTSKYTSCSTDKCFASSTALCAASSATFCANS